MTEPRTLQHVAVIGAGVCGLAAAWELLRSGAARRVTVLEADERPGGMARSVYDPSGLTTDLGPHRIHTEIPEIDALLRDLCDDDMFWVDRKSAMFVEGRLVNYPFSIGGVLSLYGPVEFTRMGLSAVWGKASGLWKPRPRNFEEHMRRAFGNRVWKRVLSPYSEKVWKIDPQDISVKAAEVRVSAGSIAKMARRLLSGGRERPGEETALRHFRYLRGGVESLVKRLSQRVIEAEGDIECQRRVERLVLGEDDRWTVHHSGGALEADAVISTIPITQLPEMLVGQGNLVPPSAAIAALEYLGIVLVFLILRRSQVSENQWLYFPDRDLCFNRGYEPRRFWDDPNSPRDRTLLSLEITARAGAEILTASDQEITDQAVGDIARVGLIKPEEVEKSIVARLPFGYPLYDCLADTNAQRVFDFLRQWPGLVTTGRQGLFSHNNMDHSIHMGLESARALAAGPEGLTRWYDRTEKLRHFRIVD